MRRMMILWVLAIVAGCNSAQYIEERGRRTEMTAGADYKTTYELLHSHFVAGGQTTIGLTGRTTVQGSVNPIEKSARIETALESGGFRDVGSVIRVHHATEDSCTVIVFSDPACKRDILAERVAQWLREANLLIESPAQLSAGR